MLRRSDTTFDNISVSMDTRLSDGTLVYVVDKIYNDFPSVALDKMEVALSQARTNWERVTFLIKMLRIEENPLEPTVTKEILDRRVAAAFEGLGGTLRTEIQEVIWRAASGSGYNEGNVEITDAVSLDISSSTFGEDALSIAPRGRVVRDGLVRWRYDNNLPQ